MGSNERRLFGHGESALEQAQAAYRYFVALGPRLEPVVVQAVVLTPSLHDSCAKCGTRPRRPGSQPRAIAGRESIVCPSGGSLDRLRPLDEAAAYARCHGDRDESVRIVKLPPAARALRPPRDRRGDPAALRGADRRPRRRHRARTDARPRPAERLRPVSGSRGAVRYTPLVATAHSSSGLGHRPLTAAARVRIPYGP